MINLLKKKSQKEQACAKKAHSGGEVIMISSYHFQIAPSCYCTECDSYYNRRATPGEINNFNETTNRPMTI